MPTFEELSDKINRLERDQRSRSRLYLLYGVNSLLLLVIGFFLIRGVQRSEAEFRQLELEVKRLEATQEKLADSLSVIPDPVYVTHPVKSSLLDDPSKKTSAIGTVHDLQSLNPQLFDRDPVDGPNNPVATARVDGAAAKANSARTRGKRYYIVVASAAPENRHNAIRRAAELRLKGYRSAVRSTESGHLVVTLGPVPREEAQLVRADAISHNDVKDDSYLSEGKTFTKQIYPE